MRRGGGGVREMGEGCESGKWWGGDVSEGGERRRGPGDGKRGGWVKEGKVWGRGEGVEEEKKGQRRVLERMVGRGEGRRVGKGVGSGGEGVCMGAEGRISQRGLQCILGLGERGKS